nr:MAG TPA_asm: hypothetical protein [Caudoviricetes sp.]
MQCVAKFKYTYGGILNGYSTCYISRIFKR